MSGIVLPTLFVLEIKLVGYCMSVVDEKKMNTNILLLPLLTS